MFQMDYERRMTSAPVDLFRIVADIRERTDFAPRFGVVLGSGLGGLAQEVEVVTRISYADLTGFPRSTVEGHAGEYIFGYINGVPVVLMNGRVHYYEGYSMEQVVAPVRVMALLGVDALGVNCSAGPADLQPVVREMLRVAPSPVIVQANAGLPEVVDGVTTYTLPPADYAAAVVPMIEAGASVVGGCCGTNPDYIREEAGLLTDRAVQPRSVDDGQALALAREAADEGGRDGDIIALILEAADTAALKDALIEEFDLDW